MTQPIANTEQTEQTEQPTTGPDGQGAAAPGRQQQGNEAARRRVELRAVQAQRDALQQRLDAAHRRDVLRLAGERLADAADAFPAGFDVAELLDDDGDIDDDKVTAAVDAAVQAHPHWERGHGARELEMSNGQPKKLRTNLIRPDESDEKPSWSGLLSNRG